MSGMKSSTIKLVLKQKLDDMLKSILDKKVVDAIKADVIVSGGAIASMLAGEKINDYDLYFRTRETARLVAKYYVDLFNLTNSLSTTAMRSCNPQIKDEMRFNVKGIEENRIVIFMQSSGVASEKQIEYDYFESRSEVSADEFMDSISTNPLETAQELHQISKDKKSPYRPVFFSENAITLDLTQNHISDSIQNTSNIVITTTGAASTGYLVLRKIAGWATKVEDATAITRIKRRILMFNAPTVATA